MNSLPCAVLDLSSTGKLHDLQKASNEQFEAMRELVRVLALQSSEIRMPNEAYAQRFLSAFDPDDFLVQRTYNWQWIPEGNRTRKGWNPLVKWNRLMGPILRDPREEAAEAKEIIEWLRTQGEEPTEEELQKCSPRIPKDSIVVLCGRELRFSYD